MLMIHMVFDQAVAIHLQPERNFKTRPRVSGYSQCRLCETACVVCCNQAAAWQG